MPKPKRDTVRIQVTLLRELAAELNRRADRNYRSLSQECAYLIESGLQSEGAGGMAEPTPGAEARSTPAR